MEGERVKTKRSIFKSGEENKDAKKRLSFATHTASETTGDSPVVGSRRSITSIVPTNMKNRIQDLKVTPQKKGQELGTQDSSQLISQSELQENITIISPACKNIRRTTMGLCYVPKKMPEQPITQHKQTVLMRNNKKNNIHTVLHSIATPEPTVNILIIGDKILGEKIKASLLYQHSFQRTPNTIKWNLTLNIVCDDNPSADTLPSVHFFFLLVFMDKLESLSYMSIILTKIDKAGVSCKQKLVLSVSSAQELHKNVIGLENFESFLDHHQLVYIPWEKQGRPSDHQVKKLLSLTYKSVGYYKDCSLLESYIMLRGVKDYQDDDTILQEGVF
ncbi:uncharacterized protein LOC121867991 [Homarus americanus]|uniref:uncharacterized protein LOC121867991 n=1 Tax=Homarus americanus TaxID=6706 RepID=UPI001C45BBCD|nr:uncharacterized protein LOC121867991 [Homarus americanus]